MFKQLVTGGNFSFPPFIECWSSLLLARWVDFFEVIPYLVNDELPKGAIILSNKLFALFWLGGVDCFFFLFSSWPCGTILWLILHCPWHICLTHKPGYLCVCWSFQVHLKLLVLCVIFYEFLGQLTLQLTESPKLCGVQWSIEFYENLETKWNQISQVLLNCGLSLSDNLYFKKKIRVPRGH